MIKLIGLFSVVAFLSVVPLSVKANTINIAGDAQFNARTKSVTAVALGRNAKANINVAGIQLKNKSFMSGGGYHANVRTGSVTAIAIGRFGTGSINMGGVQEK
jgi:hypothetical protein